MLSNYPAGVTDSDFDKDLTVYELHGYMNRDEYLENLADDYNVSIETVTLLADVLGESEDFDGLVTELLDRSGG